MSNVILSAQNGRLIIHHHAPERSGDIRHSVVDARQVRQVMGFTAMISLSEDLESYVAWLRAAHGAN